ncbi:PE family protein, partial [Mycobacterium paragordonae]
MSFVIAVPEFVEAAAEQLAGIGSSLGEITSSAAGATTALAPAAADEVSTAIARLFGTLGSDYQAVSAQAAAYHEEFVAALSRGATAYAAAEAVNISALFNLNNIVANIEIGLGNIAAGFQGGLSGSLPGLGGSISGSGSLGLNAANALRAVAALPSLGAGLALQTGGALASGFGAGLAQTGQVITNLGVGLGGAGASLSAAGAALTGQGNAALAALLNGTLGANLSANLSANFTGALPSLAVLAQTGGQIIGNFSAALSQAVQTGVNLAGNLGVGLPALGAQLSAALSAGLGGLPSLAATFNGALTGGLNTLVNLAGNLTLPPLPGFPGFQLPPLNFGLPPLNIPGFPGLVLPNFGAALTGGLNTLANLAGNLTLPPLPGFPGFQLPPLNFGLPPLNVPGFPGLVLPNFGAALTGGLNTLVNLAGNLTLPPLPGFPGFQLPPLNFGLPPLNIPGFPGLVLPNFGAALTGGLNTLANLAGNLTLPPLPGFPGFQLPPLNFGLPPLNIPGFPGLVLPNFGAALTGGLNTLVNLAGNLTLPPLPGFPGFQLPPLNFGLPPLNVPGFPGLVLPNFGAALTGGLNTLANLAGNLT